MGVTWGNLKEAQESCEKVVFSDGGQMGGLFVTLNNLQLSINVKNSNYVAMHKRDLH
jgi:hypothetical protein